MPWHPLWEKAKVVSADEFVSRQQAQEELGLRLVGTVNMRVAHGNLDGAVLGASSSDLGVTRSSLDAEIRWWREATLAQRWRRHARTLINNL